MQGRRAGRWALCALAAATVSVVAPGAAQATSTNGDCRTVFDPLTEDHYAASTPTDARCSLGSVTKSMTLYLGLEAQASGLVSASEQVPLSAFSTTFGCTCLGSYSTDPSVDTDAERFDWVKPGERVRWDDLLSGVAMSAAEPTVTVAEEVARRTLESKGINTGTLSSDVLVSAFVTMMNAKAKALGMKHSKFTNPHGGAAFAPGDPVAPEKDSRTSARDMARLWARGIKNFPAWTSHMGITDETITTTTASGAARQYRFAKGYGYAPGAIADKNGSNTGDATTTEYCFRCQTSLVERVGRRFIAVVQMSTDAAAATRTVLRSAYATVFRPKRMRSGKTSGVAGGPGAGAPDLVCTGTGRCITLETRKGRLIARSWTSGTFETKQTGVRTLPSTTGTREHALSRLDAGAYDAFVIRRRATGVQAFALRSGADGGPQRGPVHSIPTSGEGPVAAMPFGKNRVLTAHATPTSTTLTVWRVASDKGTLTPLPAVELSPAIDGGLALEGVGLARSTALVALKTAQGVALIAFAPGADDELVYRGSAVPPGLTNVSDVVATGVNRAVVVGPDGNGRLAQALLTLETAGGNLALVGETTTIDPAKAGSRAVGAFLGETDSWAYVRINAGKKTSKLYVTSLDPVPGFPAQDQVLARLVAGPVQAIGGIERVSHVDNTGPDGEGEHVVAVRGQNGRIKLIRVLTAPRSTPKDW